MATKQYLLFFALVFAGTAVQGETTLLDNNHFAFKPAQPFAVKESGRWAVPRFSLTLGMEKDPKAPRHKVLPGYTFVLDASQAGVAVPKICQQRFTSKPNQEHATMTMPTSVFDFGAVEQMILFREGCSATIWMSGQRSYWGQTRFEGSEITPPQRESVSHGLVEFQSREGTTLIQFAIEVQDL